MPLDLPQNYFELFRLPVSPEVDEPQLTERYRSLQRELHPDRFAAASDPERRLAAQAAAHVNQAHRTLADRHERGRYLLGLHGVALDDEQDTSTDTEFLMQQMELREELEALDTAQAAESFAARLQREAAALWDGFAAGCAAANWVEARDLLLRFHFYRRLQQQLQARREQLRAG